MPNTELRPILAIQEKEEITILNFFGPIAEKWWEDEKCFDVVNNRKCSPMIQ